MGLVSTVVQDFGGLERNALTGDLICSNESVPASNVNNAVTVTAPLLANPLFLAAPTAAATYTMDTAANLVAGLAPFYNYNPNALVAAGTVVSATIPAGTAFRWRVICSTAFAITVAATANTGVIVNRGSVAASTTRDFLVTVRNGSPAQVFAGNTTNASAVVSGFTQDQLSKLSVGMIVTNAVANLQGQTIIAINLNAGTITMSANANATAVGSAINFSPVVVVDGI